MFVSLYNENHSHESAGTVGAVGLGSCLEVEHLAVGPCSFCSCSSVPFIVPRVPGNLDNASLSRGRAPSTVPQQCKQPFYLGDLPGSRNRQGNSYIKLVWDWLKPTWTGLKWNNNLIPSPVSPISSLPASASGSVARYGLITALK